MNRMRSTFFCAPLLFVMLLCGKAENRSKPSGTHRWEHASRSTGEIPHISCCHFRVSNFDAFRKGKRHKTLWRGRCKWAVAKPLRKQKKTKSYLPCAREVKFSSRKMFAQPLRRAAQTTVNPKASQKLMSAENLIAVKGPKIYNQCGFCERQKQRLTSTQKHWQNHQQGPSRKSCPWFLTLLHWGAWWTIEHFPINLWLGPALLQTWSLKCKSWRWTVVLIFWVVGWFFSDLTASKYQEHLRTYKSSQEHLRTLKRTQPLDTLRR